MPQKLTNTANRANGQGYKKANLGGKSPGKDLGKLSNTVTRSTSKTGNKSPAKFGKLGMNTTKAVKPSGSKGGY